MIILAPSMLSADFKELGKEILKKPVATGIFDYNGSSSWPAWELNYEELNREPQNTTKIKN